ncbi:MAG: hypothetical protein F6K34_01430 [Okeania sp. SIO4D6]|nr:hypothetical protein [Okeania sp. SIO4D6]
MAAIKIQLSALEIDRLQRASGFRNVTDYQLVEKIRKYLKLPQIGEDTLRAIADQYKQGQNIFSCVKQDYWMMSATEIKERSMIFSGHDDENSFKKEVRRHYKVYNKVTQTLYQLKARAKK